MSSQALMVTTSAYLLTAKQAPVKLLQWRVQAKSYSSTRKTFHFISLAVYFHEQQFFCLRRRQGYRRARVATLS